MPVLHAGEPRRDRSLGAPTAETHPKTTFKIIRRGATYLVLGGVLVTAAVAGVAWKASNSGGNPSQTNICTMETAYNQSNTLGPNTDPACPPTP